MIRLFNLKVCVHNSTKFPGDHQSHKDSSSGDHKCLSQSVWQYIGICCSKAKTSSSYVMVLEREPLRINPCWQLMSAHFLWESRDTERQHPPQPQSAHLAVAWQKIQKYPLPFLHAQHPFKKISAMQHKRTTVQSVFRCTSPFCRMTTECTVWHCHIMAKTEWWELMQHWLRCADL